MSCCAILLRLRGGAAIAVAMLAVAFACAPAKAETLEQALADAYLVNPVLISRAVKAMRCGSTG